MSAICVGICRWISLAVATADHSHQCTERLDKFQTSAGLKTMGDLTQVDSTFAWLCKLRVTSAETAELKTMKDMGNLVRSPRSAQGRRSRSPAGAAA